MILDEERLCPATEDLTCPHRKTLGSELGILSSVHRDAFWQNLNKEHASNEKPPNADTSALRLFNMQKGLQHPRKAHPSHLPSATRESQEPLVALILSLLLSAPSRRKHRHCRPNAAEWSKCETTPTGRKPFEPASGWDLRRRRNQTRPTSKSRRATVRLLKDRNCGLFFRR